VSHTPTPETPQEVQVAPARCPCCGWWFVARLERWDDRWYLDCPLDGQQRWKAHAPGGHTQERS
jgi:hypothetical protein